MSTGAGQVADALRDLSGAVVEGLRAADEAAALDVAAAAPPFTPRRTGALAAGFFVVDSTVSNRQDYAGFVHDRHPFLVEAADSLSDPFTPHLDAVADAVADLRSDYQ